MMSSQAELGLMALADVWLLQAAQLWTSLASKPLGNLCKRRTPDSRTSASVRKESNWAWHLLRAMHEAGYDMHISSDDLNAIYITAWK